MISKITPRNIVQNFFPVLLPFILFLLHAFLFMNWIIDDAGISFAYARNFADGYGLVSQPGMTPVEGFSNFTWVLLMSLFFKANIFDPLITPKIISVIIVLILFIVVRKILGVISSHANAGAFFVLTFLALNSSFVIWTTSGLENPLYVLLISLLLLAIIYFYRGESNRFQLAGIIAFISALCALTRPDGILYAGVFPVLVCFDFASGKRQIRDSIKSMLVYLGGFLLLFGSYMVFRYLYFGDLLPNPYYAKNAELLFSPHDWGEKFSLLLQSVLSEKYLAAGILAIIVYLAIKRCISRHYLIVFFLLFAAALPFFLLPEDWMPEFRFATPFFFLFYLFIFLTGNMIYERAAPRKPFGIILIFLTIVFTGSNIVSFIARSNEFAQDPTVPLTKVAEVHVDRFNEYTSKLGIRGASILIPDLGGMLYYSPLRIYDLAGLTDKVIAKNLGKNQDVFYDYVFETLKPSFIHIHGWWAYVSNFDADPRFRRDYAVINESSDAWILANEGESMLSGDYVRKEAIKNESALMEIQANFDKK